MQPRQAVPNHAYANGYVRPASASAAPFAARPVPVSAPAAAPYRSVRDARDTRGLRDVRDMRDVRDARDVRDVRDARDVRRDRFAYERREARPLVLPEPRTAELRHQHAAQPDYTQVRFTFTFFLRDILINL